MSILSGLTIDQLELIINENPKLRGIIQGYIAEYKLMEKLLTIPGVTDVKKISDSLSVKRDIGLMYYGTEITIECKSLVSASVKEDTVLGTWQGTVSCKNSDKIEDIDGSLVSNLRRGSFDIMSISTYAVNNEWDSVFIENRFIPQANPDRWDLMKTSFVVNPMTTPCIETDLEKILKSVREYKLK